MADKIDLKTENFTVSGGNVIIGSGNITNITNTNISSGVESNIPRTNAGDDRQASLRRQLVTHRKNLNRLEEQLAKYGASDAPLRLLNQIDDERATINKIEDSLVG